MFRIDLSNSRIITLLNISICSFYAFWALLLIAIICYPGTNYLDDSAIGYDMTKNFLSDLGRTLNRLGEPNFYSSTAFTIATIMVCIGLTSYSIIFPHIVNRDGPSFHFARGGSIAGIISGISFMGIGLTPFNYYPQWHEFFVHLGFRMFLLFMVCQSIAIVLNKVGLSKNSVWVYLTFGLVLLFYIFLLIWGPKINEPNGLAIQVISQKITVVGLSITVFIQSLIMKRHFRSLPAK